MIKAYFFTQLEDKLNKIFRRFVRHGFYPTFMFVLRKLKKKFLPSKTISIRDSFNFINVEEAADPFVPSEQNAQTINWFIPPFGFGSGGHTTIFRFIYGLERLGFHANLVCVGFDEDADPLEILENIKLWFFPISCDVYLGISDAPFAKFSVATSWETAYWLKHFSRTSRKIYFVQDFEPYFYPRSSLYFLAEETYKFGFYGITAGSWLKTKLQDDYSMECTDFSFGYAKDQFFPLKREPRCFSRVLFYSRPPTERRAFELGILAFEKLSKLYPELVFILMGWDLSNFNFTFNYENPGIVNRDDLNDLYNTCDIALVLSLTNLSLLPIELMASGTVVVSNKGPNTEWFLNEKNSKLVDTSVDAIISGISCLLESPSELLQYRLEGFNSTKNLDWAYEFKKVAGIFEK